MPTSNTATSNATSNTTTSGSTNNNQQATTTTDASSTATLITVTGQPSTSLANKYYTQGQTYTKTWRNYCPLCHKVGSLTDNPKGVAEHEISCYPNGCGADYDVTTGGEKLTTPRGFLVDANGRSNSASSVDTTIGDATSGSTTGVSSQSTASPLLSGEMTFQELIGEITEGIDLVFLCKRNNVVVTDFETLYAEAEYLREKKPAAVDSEDIKLHQLEDGSYEMTVDQYGFYNTVYVKYNGGTVVEDYEDLVRIYGEMPITYKEPKLNKSTAIMKAKAYLAAHIREYNMHVKCNIIHDPSIDIGDIVTLENPLTLKDTIRKVGGRPPEYLFVEGLSVSWDGGPMTADLDLTYAPELPERKEPTTSGGSSASNTANTATNVVTNADGSTTVTNADGSTTTTQPDGSSVTTDAAGNVIAQTEATSTGTGSATTKTPIKVKTAYKGASKYLNTTRVTTSNNATGQSQRGTGTSYPRTSRDKTLKAIGNGLETFAKGFFKW